MRNPLYLSITRLTQLAFLAFGRTVLYLLSFCVFALRERKNAKPLNREYHAAAGYSHVQATTA
jgi:hypothetical protein